MSEFDPLDIEAQRLARIALKEKQDAEALKASEDIKWLMSNERGRRVVWRLLEQSGVYRSSYAPETNAVFFREGERNQGLKLMAAILDACPEQYSRMTLEHRYEQYADLV